MWTEADGSALLRSVFSRRGYALVAHFPFSEGEGDDNVSFKIDGWDDNARIGFEFLSHAENDHDDLTVGDIRILQARFDRNELHIFIVDERDFDSEAALEIYADAFIDDVERRKSTSPR